MASRLTDRFTPEKRRVLIEPQIVDVKWVIQLVRSTWGMVKILAIRTDPHMRAQRVCHRDA